MDELEFELDRSSEFEPCDERFDPSEEEFEEQRADEDDDAEFDRDMLLEQQELDDLENFYGPTDGPDSDGEW